MLLELLTFLLLEYDCRTSTIPSAANSRYGTLKTRIKKNDYNLNVVYKRLDPIEIGENVQIGHLIVDLKDELLKNEIQPDQSTANYHYNFEFINDLNDLNKDQHFNLNGFSNTINRKKPTSSQTSTSNSFYMLKKYFLLDVYTGAMFTSKSLDLENFCDLCQMFDDSENELDQVTASQRDTCIIELGVKATKYVLLDKNSPTPINKQNEMDSVYFILFDLVIKDLNEFKPSFDRKQPLVFNISEEIAPIRLNLGLMAYDNDCTDRSMLNYFIRIVKVNDVTFEEFMKKSATLGSSTQPDFYFYDPNHVNLNSNTNRNNEMLALIQINQTNIFELKVIIDPDQTLLFLYTEKPLDRELTQSIELDVLVSDHNKIDLANLASLKVFINVIDINDNEPRFFNQVKNYQIFKPLISSKFYRFKNVQYVGN
jgi:hypothetical protein